MIQGRATTSDLPLTSLVNPPITFTRLLNGWWISFECLREPPAELPAEFPNDSHALEYHQSIQRAVHHAIH